MNHKPKLAILVDARLNTFKASVEISNFLTKEIEIVHRLSLVRISYCVGTCRVKQKRKQTKVFTNHVGGFVDSYSGSCSNTVFSRSNPLPFLIEGGTFG